MTKPVVITSRDPEVVDTINKLCDFMQENNIAPLVGVTAMSILSHEVLEKMGIDKVEHEVKH